MTKKLLIINPGSTSTKIAVYENEQERFVKSITHKTEELSAFSSVMDQYSFRRDAILSFLAENQLDLNELSAVVGRGGILPPVQSGGYLVNDAMIQRLTHKPAMRHASNLGASLAKSIADPLGIPAYIYDAITSDEFPEIARVTGFPEVVRRSFCHVLNTKSIARKYAQSINRHYEDLNLVMVHLGGGITVSYHEKGRIIDSTSDDYGCFSPERAGTVPITPLVELCFSGKWTEAEMQKKIRGGSGLKALLGTSDCREVEERIDHGDEKAKLVFDAMVYQITKSVGALAMAGKVLPDAIILTGGIAHSKRLTDFITTRASQLAPVVVLPGENEMESLALGGLRLLLGEEKAHEYIDEEYR